MTGKTESEKRPPAYGAGSLSYNKYLKVEEIKQLQHCLSEPPHHDEPLFIIIHQTYELWFKLILHEIDEVIRLMDESSLRRATFFMRRVNTIFKVLVNQIHILETMAPVDFLGFRSNLNPASGFQSSQFREIEFASGIKEPRMMDFFAHEPAALASLKRRLEEPSLSDAFYALLKRRGFQVDVIIENEESEAGKAEHEKRTQELRRIYERPDEYLDLYELSESLVDLDEHLALWRTHHVTVVERIIGFKRGTGGSEGVGYLRSTLHKRAFPDLWNVRSVLELA